MTFCQNHQNILISEVHNNQVIQIIKYKIKLDFKDRRHHICIHKSINLH